MSPPGQPRFRQKIDGANKSPTCGPGLPSNNEGFPIQLRASRKCSAFPLRGFPQPFRKTFSTIVIFSECPNLPLNCTSSGVLDHHLFLPFYRSCPFLLCSGVEHLSPTHSGGQLHEVSHGLATPGYEFLFGCPDKKPPFIIKPPQKTVPRLVDGQKNQPGLEFLFFGSPPSSPSHRPLALLVGGSLPTVTCALPPL